MPGGRGEDAERDGCSFGLLLIGDLPDALSLMRRGPEGTEHVLSSVSGDGVADGSAFEGDFAWVLTIASGSVCAGSVAVRLVLSGTEEP